MKTRRIPGDGKDDGSGTLGAVPGAGAAAGLHATRRGGARLEVSARVTLRGAEDAATLEGWVLNVSRGGVRVILEDRIELGAEFVVTVAPTNSAGAPNASLPEGLIMRDPPADGADGGVTAALDTAPDSPPEQHGALVRTGRVVWVQQEPDGVIAGLEFRTDSAGKLRVADASKAE